MSLSREEAQALIYRGWGRLALAMKVKHIPDHMAQEWEDGALQEAHAIVAAAKKGPIANLAIPPIPLALIEVHRSLLEQRPLRPSDVHSPFEQARSSPWAKWVSDTNDEQIPPKTDLGDPSTFWWMSPKEKKECNFTFYGYLRDEQQRSLHPSFLPPPSGPTDYSAKGPSVKPRVAEKQGPKGALAKVDNKTNRPPKRQHGKESSSEYEESAPEGDYVYNPKCDYCKERNLACTVQSEDGQQACIACKERKTRCSALHGGNRAVRKSAANKGPGPIKRSVVDMLLSTASARTVPPSKRQRVFVDVPPASTSKAEQSNVATFKSGPPGGKYKHQIRAERAGAATSRHGADALDSPSHRGMTATPTTTTHTKTMVDKSVSTESQLSEWRDTSKYTLKVSMTLIQEVIQKLDNA